ncbi:hypothetical protein L9F63_013908, partial [Diploptera punctata]
YVHRPPFMLGLIVHRPPLFTMKFMLGFIVHRYDVGLDYLFSMKFMLGLIVHRPPSTVHR